MAMNTLPLRHELKYFINERQYFVLSGILDSKQDLVSAVLNIEGVHDATLVACQVEAGT